MALFAGGAVVNGKWAHTSPSPPAHLSVCPKTIQFFPHTGPLSSRLCILEIYTILSPLQPVAVNQGNQWSKFWRKQLSRLVIAFHYIAM